MCRSSGALLLALAVPVLLSTGCRCPHYGVYDMESRTLATPYATLDYFRYAMRREDWDAVYETLSTKTQNRIAAQFGAKTAFPFYVAGIDIYDLDPKAPPEIQDMKLVEVLHRAQILNVTVDEKAGQAVVFLHYPPLKVEPFVLVREGERPVFWKVGIEEWLELRRQ